MLQQAALPQSTQGMQVSFAPPPQATLPQSQRVRPSPPNQGQHGYMPRQRPSQPPRQFTQLNQPMNSCNWTVFMSNSRKRNERTRPYYRERNGPISSIGSTGLAVSSIGLLYRWVHLWLKGEDLSTLLLIPFGSLCPSKSSHSPTFTLKKGHVQTTASSWA
ncbi:hypothetical protein L1987_89035 [Smallanthus sonchifolius]|nr:hypothetical protein L1987_89035 [Smallanthus sonchifolius]